MRCVLLLVVSFCCLLLFVVACCCSCIPQIHGVCIVACCCLLLLVVACCCSCIPQMLVVVVVVVLATGFLLKGIWLREEATLKEKKGWRGVGGEGAAPPPDAFVVVVVDVLATGFLLKGIWLREEATLKEKKAGGGLGGRAQRLTPRCILQMHLLLLLLMLLFFVVACDNGFWVVVFICGASVFAPGFPVALGFFIFSCWVLYFFTVSIWSLKMINYPPARGST